MSFKLRAGIFNQYRWLISSIQWLLDGLVVVFLLLCLGKLHRVSMGHEYLILGGVTFLAVIVVFKASQLYRPWRGVNPLWLVRRVFIAWILVVILLLILGYVTKNTFIFSRTVILSWILLTPVVLAALRFFVFVGLNWARARGRNSRTVVIGGAGDLGHKVAQNIVSSVWLGIRLVGFFDDDKVGELVALNPNNLAYSVLGDLEEMVTFVRDHKIDMVYLALPLRAEKRLQQIIDALQDTTASLYLVPDIFVFSLLQATISDLRGIPLISLWESPFYGINGWLKRGEDIIFSTLILILVAPIMLGIAIGIKLTSPGPIIFKQRRYGLGGGEIIVYKFRTMLVCEDGEEIPQATRSDCRVTRFGRLLRRTSLDELPQFINVLQGRMSIVGPRPHAVAHNEFYRRHIPGYMLRHKVRPGITGWAQVNKFRGETDTLEKMEKRVEYDLDYLRNWSIWLDLKIIFITAVTLLVDDQAW
ncbi:MAG: undecaprenyl-phosphate glucose phosphotransferase [Syntrophales bacterium]|nr:undecaprenyl-phosphate glucose phosphotransferase [Syntrophales bacterium]MDD5641476.1 undecaprenyl-phosphate glucose phosphotransferase [Syntrophales bacterium]